MYKAAVDTPHAKDGDEYTFALVIDPAFKDGDGNDLIKGYTVVGATEEVSPGVILKGAGYAAESGIQPDHSVGRLGGSGNPDYCMLEIMVEDQQTLIDIDNAGDDYWVYWDSVVEETSPDGPVVLAAAAPFRPRDELPTASEFGQWRARLSNRGVPQEWITANFGTGNTRNRGENDANARAGYTLNQYGGVDPKAVASYLRREGWVADLLNNVITVWRNGDEYTFTVRQLLDRAFGNIPRTLRNDLEDALSAS